MVNYIQITKIKTVGSEFNSAGNPALEIKSALKWRNKILIVNAKDNLDSERELDVVALKADWWLINCLQKSPIKRICIAPDIGGKEALNWAMAGKQTNKQVFLRLHSDAKLSDLEKTFQWKIKRIIDFILAGLACLLLSPVIGAIALQQKLQQKPILTKNWCVGRRGLVFQAYSWADSPANSIEYISRKKFGLHKLPQLINVLRGEMSLVGHYPFSLAEAVDFNSTQRKALNTVPGVISTTPWRSPKTDLRAMSIKSYDYLCHWSLISDLRTLLLVLPRLLSGKDSRQKTVKL